MNLPISSYTSSKLTNIERFIAFFNMLLIDHGFIRYIYCNIHHVAEGVWRSANPTPKHLRWWVKQHGIRTVLNLRGQNNMSYILEYEECTRLGITLVNFPIHSRGLVSKDTIKTIKTIFETIEYPILLHCKSGSDRAGFISTLYLFLHSNVPLRLAMKKHLSLLHYGHIKQSKTGILDYFFNQFLAESKIDESKEGFFQWLNTMYNSTTLESQFNEKFSQFHKKIINLIFRRE
ncbi:MAG: tyrosine-protein phosphatase [Rhodospirillaceae bacterium]|jgi:protein tyrosine/serine phosphatase|nr:tyrosine-protein phosphatase [Rhodospirillaceae bacterium]